MRKIKTNRFSETSFRCSKCLHIQHDSTLTNPIIQICECGHGLVHHVGYFSCIYPSLDWESYSCKCKKFKIKSEITNGRRIEY